MFDMLTQDELQVLCIKLWSGAEKFKARRNAKTVGYGPWVEVLEVYEMAANTAKTPGIAITGSW